MSLSSDFKKLTWREVGKEEVMGTERHHQGPPSREGLVAPVVTTQPAAVSPLRD